MKQPSEHFSLSKPKWFQQACFKDDMPVSLRSELFTSFFLTILSSETYTRKYKKLPNRHIDACKNITDHKEFVKNVWTANSANVFASE